LVPAQQAGCRKAVHGQVGGWGVGEGALVRGQLAGTGAGSGATANSGRYGPPEGAKPLVSSGNDTPAGGIRDTGSRPLTRWISETHWPTRVTTLDAEWCGRHAGISKTFRACNGHRVGTNSGPIREVQDAAF
jgi:hypothetical protein